MSGFEREADLLDNFDRSFGRELTLLGQQGLEVAALDEFHGDELDAVGFAQIENADHVAVRYLARQDELLLEALQNFRQSGQFGTDHFESHQAVEFTVAGFVYGAHAALS